MTIHDFLKALYTTDNISGYLSLWTRQDKLSTHIAAKRLAEISETSVSLSAKGKDVYFGVGLRAHKLHRTQRGTADDICSIPGVWLDLDIGTDAHKNVNYPPTATEAYKLIEEIGIEPTLLVDSGYGLHVYWLFDEPRIIDDINRKDTRRLVTAMQDKFIKNRHGWKVDNTADLARILRVPGTRNYKIPESPRDVKVIMDSGPRYKYDELKALLGVNTLKEEERTVESSLVKDECFAKWQKRIPDLRKEKSRELATAAMNGDPLSDEGGRDNALNVVVNILSALIPDAEPEFIVEFLRPSLAAMQVDEDPSNPAPTEEDALDKAERAIAKVREQVQEEKIEAKRNRMSGLYKFDGTKISDVYSEQELDEFARQQSISREDQKRRWIIQHGDSVYFFVGGRYLEPVQVHHIKTYGVRDLAPSPIEFFKMTKTGPKEKTPEELINEYGTTTRTVLADLSLDESYYDARNDTFYEAVCPKRTIIPVYDPLIAEWLELLGGKDSNKLLDWIATVTQLDKQTCILYLSQATGSGKNMLAHGLARIWTLGPPTELRRILENFNGDLIQCPLIFADERLPTNAGGRGSITTADLRALVGTSGRTLSRKFMEGVPLLGAVRLILAANNDELLSNTGETLTANDLEAVAGRFLHIETTETARHFLENLNKTGGTDGWVDGDKIAAHALHLAKARQIAPGKRFLVEGHVTTMHQKLATSSKLTSLVCQWLSTYLDSPLLPEIARERQKPIVGGGKLLVSSVSMLKYWESYIKKDRGISADELRKALGNITTGYKRIKNVRYHDINLDLLYGWSEQNQFADVESMKQRINVPIDLSSISEDLPTCEPISKAQKE